MTADHVAVFHDGFEQASLVRAYLESDGIDVKMVPDVHSPPLLPPGPHGVKSQYTLYILFVAEADAERSRELIDDFRAQS